MGAGTMAGAPPMAVMKGVSAMRGKLWFVGGVAVGFVLGARAGRETYDGLTRTVRKVTDSPTVQEAAGVIQEQASRFYAESKVKASAMLARCQRQAETCCGCCASETASPEQAPATPKAPDTSDAPDASGVAELGESSGPAEP